MKITTRSIYGLQALLDLALREELGPVALRDIARRQGISEKYLEQIFAQLKKAGLVSVRRGAAGGYALGPAGRETKVGQILSALEGPLVPVPCLGCGEDQACERMDDCLTRGFWEQLGAELDRIGGSVTLGDLAECCRETGDEGAGEFII